MRDEYELKPPAAVLPPVLRGDTALWEALPAGPSGECKRPGTAPVHAPRDDG